MSSRNERRARLRAFHKGKAAASAGATVDDNPYPESTDCYFKWLYGLAVGLSDAVAADPPLEVSLQ
jgi:ribosome modulation factor